ncbi:unnamed protein product [Victoria cruziana]
MLSSLYKVLEREGATLSPSCAREWGAYWVLGGILIHEFPLFKSGEHTCKVYAVKKSEDHLGSAAHPRFAIPPC